MKISKDRIALSMVENLKTYIEKAYPKDKELIKKITDVLLSICFKVQESEKNLDASC